MRFITEFEITNEELKYPNHFRVTQRKTRSEEGLGRGISDVFNFNEAGYIDKSGLAGVRRSLEIEAFPMDKWIEFKNKLIEHIGVNPGDQIGALQLIKDLEFCK